jgi:ABC-type transport system involved in multi-copper enzyme maturation permease subunit
MTASRPRLAMPRWLGRRTDRTSGIAAIVIKELRGRMRGRRTFAILTIYLVLMAAFGWMLQRMNEEAINLSTCIGCEAQTATYASATIGRGIFVGLMMLLTLIVAVLAPASTAGAISGERERQTLDLLAVTPISSPAIVLGKLLSALAWVFVLILASIPITALVFVFGGVAPDDVVRGYVVLFATAIGLGSVGLFFSALLRRTGASTGLTYVTVLALTIGSVFVWEFLHTTGARSAVTGLGKPPPAALVYLNPFLAQADVACGTESGFGTWCNVNDAVATGSSSIVDAILSRGILTPVGGVRGFDTDQKPTQPFPGNFTLPAIGAPDDGVTALSVPRDAFWPRSVAAFLGLAVVLTLLSVQLVTPSRRWRFSRLPLLRRPARRIDPDA